MAGQPASSTRRAARNMLSWRLSRQTTGSLRFQEAIVCLKNCFAILWLFLLDFIWRGCSQSEFQEANFLSCTVKNVMKFLVTKILSLFLPEKIDTATLPRQFFHRILHF